MPYNMVHLSGKEANRQYTIYRVSVELKCMQSNVPSATARGRPDVYIKQDDGVCSRDKVNLLRDLRALPVDNQHLQWLSATCRCCQSLGGPLHFGVRTWGQRGVTLLLFYKQIKRPHSFLEYETNGARAQGQNSGGSTGIRDITL